MQRPLILISNDDGYKAKGIHSLVEMISDLGDIIVCAPTLHQSGKSRAFSLNDMTLTPVYDTPELSASSKQCLYAESAKGVLWYTLTGTPVDCIKVAVSELCPRTPDLILGGINHGDNSSVNSHYSGTVGIAMEGTLKGIPSIAFSLCDYDADADFRPMCDYVRELCSTVLKKGLPKGTYLNVNVPKVRDASELLGARLCRMAKGLWINEVEKQNSTIQPDSTTSTITEQEEGASPHYILRGQFHNNEPQANDTDVWALTHGYIAITPSTIDVTDYSFLHSGIL